MNTRLSDCRICTILDGKETAHNPKRLHSNAPASNIAGIIKVFLSSRYGKRPR